MHGEDFRIVGTETVGTLGFLEMQRLSVAPQQGAPFERIVVRHPGAVAIAPITEEGVVLIRQYRAAVDEWLLEIPAGKLDHDGEAPAETAGRELEEEIGFEASDMELVGEFYTTPGFSDEFMYLYRATGLTPTQSRPVGPEEESAEIIVVPTADLSSLIEAGQVRDAKTLVALLWVMANKA